MVELGNIDSKALNYQLSGICKIDLQTPNDSHILRIKHENAFEDHFSKSLIKVVLWDEAQALSTASSVRALSRTDPRNQPWYQEPDFRAGKPSFHTQPLPWFPKVSLAGTKPLKIRTIKTLFVGSGW
jgi:hypothetical protein